MNNLFCRVKKYYRCIFLKEVGGQQRVVVVNEVKNGFLFLQKVSKKYNVLKLILYDYVIGKVKEWVVYEKILVLIVDEEKQFFKSVIEWVEMGVGFSKWNFLCVVRVFVRKGGGVI